MKYQLQRQEKDKRDYKLYRCSLIERILSVFRKPALPNSVDLRDKMPEVYDQLSIGSCQSNSSVAYRVYLSGNKDLELSRLFLYYKVREMEGTINEDAGGTHRSCLKVLNKQGVCKEELMPYDTSKFKVAPSQEAIRDALNYRISSYASVKNLTEIKKALAEKSLPVLLGMEVYESFEDDSLFVDNVMPMPKKCEKKLGGHSVLVCGFSDEKKVLICRNSWGDWEDKGYFYLSYDYVKAYTFDYWVCSI